MESEGTDKQTTWQDYTLPLVQAFLFIGSVYLQKFVRKNLNIWSKQYKEISRIIFVTLLTIILIVYNYSEICKPEAIDFQSCFYIHFTPVQCLKVLIANTILFAYHIYLKSQRGGFKFGDNSIRKIVFAPLLQQLLFRAVFFRSGRGLVSIFYLSAIFSIAHLHRHIRKAISGKQRHLGAALFQVFFTFILSLYTYFFLWKYQSITPCILLHMYCNVLGPPLIVNKMSIIYHFGCLVAFTLFMIFVV